MRVWLTRPVAELSISLCGTSSFESVMPEWSIWPMAQHAFFGGRSLRYRLIISVKGGTLLVGERVDCGADEATAV